MASLKLIVPKISEAAAPIPAAKPRLIPLGLFIIKYNVTTNMANEVKALKLNPLPPQKRG
jgi:hypothetical protein